MTLRPNCPLPKHVDGNQPDDVCWLLDARRYGLSVANALHPSPRTEALTKEVDPK